MKSYYCNPINVPYRYQFNMDPRSNGKLQIDREAADPSMILFQGKYYMFVSMNLSVWVSEDLVNWEPHRLPENLPLYDYAPDARVCGDYVYFCASKRGENCNYYRTKDIINGPYEEIPGTFDFWDPNLFFDEDGSIYFYWGCSNATPVWGVELDPETMKPKTEWKELLFVFSADRRQTKSDLCIICAEKRCKRLTPSLRIFCHTTEILLKCKADLPIISAGCYDLCNRFHNRINRTMIRTPTGQIRIKTEAHH